MRTALLLAAALAFCAGCGRAEAEASTEAGESPVDLIAPLAAFSHKIHIGDNGIGCGVCHPFARHSPVAGLASMSTCMGCHKFVDREKPDIQRLARAAAAGQGIAWPRIHRLPDHVFFSHERHVSRGLACAECHGDMASRTLAVQQQDLSMGFCLECHRARAAPVDCLTCHK